MLLFSMSVTFMYPVVFMEAKTLKILTPWRFRRWIEHLEFYCAHEGAFGLVVLSMRWLHQIVMHDRVSLWNYAHHYNQCVLEKISINMI